MKSTSYPWQHSVAKYSIMRRMPVCVAAGGARGNEAHVKMTKALKRNHRIEYINIIMLAKHHLRPRSLALRVATDVVVLPNGPCAAVSSK